MDNLKNALTHAPVVKTIDYESKGKVILSVDSSLLGWGAILQQEEELESRKRHPSRYENSLWSLAEKKYDSGKLECRGLLRVLKKLRFYLYGIRFLVEIDAKTLVHQLNQPASDLPGSVVNRWLAWIRLFDFELKHVAGTKHGGPDALSRKGYDSDNTNEEDIEEIIDAELEQAYVAANEVEENIPEDFQRIIRYLTSFERPEGLMRKKISTIPAICHKILTSRGCSF